MSRLRSACLKLCPDTSASSRTVSRLEMASWKHVLTTKSREREYLVPRKISSMKNCGGWVVGIGGGAAGGVTWRTADDEITFRWSFTLSKKIQLKKKKRKIKYGKEMAKYLTSTLQYSLTHVKCLHDENSSPGCVMKKKKKSAARNSNFDYLIYLTF